MKLIGKLLQDPLAISRAGKPGDEPEEKPKRGRKLAITPERTDKPLVERSVSMSNSLTRGAQNLNLSQKRLIALALAKTDSIPVLDLQNATQTWADLQEALQGVRTPQGEPVHVALLHSRLPVAEKKSIMDAFVHNHAQVLVSTTVIEVGVDVPNASLMVIEHAERFGLSQLHQLRGRVGRGSAASVCVLLYATNDAGRVSDTAKDRLRAMIETSDGFEIARRDLAIRGPGELLGARQSGTPLLRFADLGEDALLLDWASRWAPRILRQHPQLAQRHLDRWLSSKADFLKA